MQGQENIDAHDHYDRQKRLTWILMLVVVVGVIVSALIIVISDPEQNAGANNAGEPSQSAETDHSGDESTPHSNSSGSNTPQGTDSNASSESKLKNQAQARRVEVLAIAAYPLPETRQAKGFPADKAWLPAIVGDLAKDFCDQNRALDVVGASRVEAMIPRATTALDAGDLAQICKGATTQHLILVDFETDGGGWTLRMHSKGDPEPEVITRGWPSSDVIGSLKKDIEQAAEILSGYDLHMGGVFAESDAAAIAFRDLRSEVEKAKTDATDDPRIWDRAKELLNEVLSIQPHFPYALYKRYEPFSWQPGGMDTEAAINRRLKLINEIRDQLKGENTSLRLKNFFVALVRTAQGTDLDLDAKLREEAKAIVHGILEEERLFMPAVYSRQFTDFPYDPVGGAEQAMKEYPLDGRFHLQLARKLSVDPTKAPRAIALASEGTRLVPWDYSAYAHRALARIMQADYKLRNQEWDTDKASEEFNAALNDAIQGWKEMPNQIGVWFELMVRALTHDNRKGAWLKNTKAFEFVYLFAIISDELSPFPSPSAESVLSKRIPDTWIEDYRPRLESRLEDAMANPWMQDGDVYLLAAIAQYSKDLVYFQSRGELTPHARKVAKTLQDALRVYYEKLGGRATKVVEMWNLYKDINFD